MARSADPRRVAGGKPGGPWLALSVQARRVSAAVGDATATIARVDDSDMEPAANQPVGAPAAGFPRAEVPGNGTVAKRLGSAAPTSRLALTIIDRALARAGVGLGDLAGLCVADGPGPFTAIRVAMSVIQGIGVARRLPAIPTPSLAALAVTMARAPLAVGDAPWPRSALVLTAVDARMGECYFGAWWVTVVRGTEGTGQAVTTLLRPVECLASAVASGQRIRPVFEQLVARTLATAGGADRDGAAPATARIRPRVMLAGSGFQVDPVLAGWRPAGECELLVNASLEADAAGVLAAALSPRAASVTLQAAPVTPVTPVTIAAGEAAAPAACDWGPLAAAELRPRYVRDKVALDVDEQRRLVAARDAASSRG